MSEYIYGRGVTTQVFESPTSELLRMSDLLTIPRTLKDDYASRVADQLDDIIKSGQYDFIILHNIHCEMLFDKTKIAQLKSTPRIKVDMPNDDDLCLVFSITEPKIDIFVDYGDYMTNLRVFLSGRYI